MTTAAPSPLRSEPQRGRFLHSRYELNARARWRFSLLRSSPRESTEIQWTDRGWHRVYKWLPALLLLVIADIIVIPGLIVFYLNSVSIADDWIVLAALVCVHALIALPLVLLSRRGRRLELSGDRFRFFHLSCIGQTEVDAGRIEDLRVVLRQLSVCELNRTRLFYALLVERGPWSFLLAAREADGTFDAAEFRAWCLELLPMSLSRRGLPEESPLGVNAPMG